MAFEGALKDLEEKSTLSLENETIEAAEQLGIDFLYDLEHGQNNLFFVGMSGIKDAYFRISNFSITPPSLSFERNNNRNLSITGATVPEEVSIEWIEDTFRSVEKYHLSWLRTWYDFNNDCVPIGIVDSKFKDLVLTAFHYKNVNGSSSAPVSKPEVVFRIHLYDCVPTNMGGSQEFNWEGGGLKTLSVTYKVSKIAYDYIGNLYMGIGSENTARSGYLLATHEDRRSSLGNETTSVDDNERWSGWSAWNFGKSSYGEMANPNYKPSAETEKDKQDKGSAKERNIRK